MIIIKQDRDIPADLKVINCSNILRATDRKESILETRDGERKLYQSDDYLTPVIYNAQTHDP